MKGLIMFNKIKNVLLYGNRKQLTIKLGSNANISFTERLRNLFDLFPKYARQEIRIEQKRRF